MCGNVNVLQEVTNNILSQGGEGTILRKKESSYINGKSDDLLKYKASRRDEEAIVTRIDPPSVTLLLPSGENFTTTNWECEEVAQIGQVVTFSHAGFSSLGNPVDPKVIKSRTDVNWHDLLYSHSANSLRLNEISSKGLEEKTKRKIQGHWTMNELENTKTFFDSLQHSLSRDPLLPHSWYSISLDDIISREGGSSIMSIYNGSIVNALMDTYPNIGLERSKFSIDTRKLWNFGNKRKIFDNFAQAKGFDPLQSDNWISVPLQEITSDKGVGYILKFVYGGSISRALGDIYKLEPSTLPSRSVWNKTNLRKFFDSFALKRNLDPLIPSSWYSISNKQILNEKGGYSVLSHYGSYIKALIDLYPSLHFDLSKFDSKPKNYWQEKTNRQKFFDDFAEWKGFNATDPSMWYTVRAEELKEKGGHSILNMHSGSLSRALMDVYPDLTWEKDKFKR